MQLDRITPMILTYNEQDNIRRCIASLNWARRILVVDSRSTDGTNAILSEYGNVDVILRDFDNHTNQWNFGLDHIRSEWVLALDADYICEEQFNNQLLRLTDDAEVYFATFRYAIMGKVLTGSLYPPRAVLFRPKQCRYKADGHTQLLDVAGRKTKILCAPIIHDDRKPLKRWISSQVNYAELESQKLQNKSMNELGWKDRIRKRVFFAPWLTLLYCLFAKRLILDGRAGLYYSLQRVFAEIVLSLTLLDRKLRAKD